MPLAQVNDIEIYYEEHGSGFPLCLIMGFGEGCDAWFEQTPAFAKDYRTIIFDHRGCGRSEKPPGGYSITQFTDDAVSLLKSIGIRRAHFLGYSMGGRIGQDLAARYPDFVQSLVLAATAANLNPLNRYALRAGAYLYENFGPDAAAAFGPLIGFTRAYFDRHAPELIAKIGKSSDNPMPLHAYLGHVRAIEEHDTTGALAKIRAPTLVMLGDHEWLNALPDSMVLANGIPGAKLRVLSGGGHGFIWEIPEAFNRAVLEFVRQHTP
jgi:pimeloyl-ACP methyl ester carboxylesterase